LIGAFNSLTGVATTLKVVTIDSTYDLSNAQLVPDLSSSLTTGFNLYLVVSVKLGYHLYIQKLSETSLTFSSSALKYHSSTSPVYLDTQNNVRTQVFGLSDSYFILANFK
jgi:hypothetical protein